MQIDTLRSQSEPPPVWISDAKKFLFVHVQKTAGQSMVAALRAAIPDLRPFLGTHDTARAAREVLGPTFNDFLRVGFVRNPWDRLVAWHSMIVQRGGERDETPEFWRYVLERGRNFDDFIERCVDTVADSDGLESAIRPQVDYLCDENGAELVNFIGSFESLPHDYIQLAHRLGLASTAPPHLNASRHEHYSTYYSERTRAVVAQRFAQDLERFGYRFESVERPVGHRSRRARALDERGPLVITGMHRSGTSLTARLFAASGVDLGRELLPADANNPHGYFEDRELLALDRQMLAAATEGGSGGHPDWGWTEDGILDRTRFEAFAGPAQEILKRRTRTAEGRWGWKDPRATLALDFWSRQAEDPIFVLVYRFPWEVVDSIQRLGVPHFLRHPDYAWRIWCAYQCALLDFRRRHPSRSVLVSVNALLADSKAGLELLGDRIGLRLDPDLLLEHRDRLLFRSLPAQDPLVSLFVATHPEAASLLRELDREADLPADGLWQPQPLSSLSCRAPSPVVSVVIPCRNDGEELVEAVASVHRSVPTPSELLIVDDGSTEPGTLEILATLSEAGYVVLQQPNTGLAGARNRGFEAARAPFVLPLDADNRLLPGFVTRAIEILEQEPEVGAVYGDRFEFGLRTGMVAVPDPEHERLLLGNYIDACAVLRKRLWSDACGYDSGLPHPGLEDWELWLGAIRKGWRLCRVPQPAFEYRVRPGSMITGLDDPEALASTLRYIVGKHFLLYQTSVASLRHLKAQVAEQSLALSAQRSVLLAAEERAKEAGEQQVALLTALEVAEARGQEATVRADSAEAEIERWRERVAFMERTRAWLLRHVLIGVKDRLRRFRKG